jgi:hypothetical protein
MENPIEYPSTAFIQREPSQAGREHMTKTEKEVAIFLDKLGLNWSYETPVFLWDNENRPRVWTPDFYLPRIGVHIEVWNSGEATPEYRERAYRRNGINVVFVHTYKEESQWKKFLISRITFIEQQRHAQIMNMLLNSTLKQASDQESNPK